jgi:hypothetical protein
MKIAEHDLHEQSHFALPRAAKHIKASIIAIVLGSISAAGFLLRGLARIDDLPHEFAQTPAKHLRSFHILTIALIYPCPTFPFDHPIFRYT